MNSHCRRGIRVAFALVVSSFLPLIPAVADHGEWTSNGPGARYVYDIVTDPSDSDIVYVAIHRGVYKSTNAGFDWARSNSGITEGARSLLIDDSAPAILYAGTEDGVFKTVDSGATWAPASAGITDGTTPVTVTKIVFDPTDSTTLYAVAGSGGLFRSTDSAASWTNLRSNIPAGQPILSVAVDPLQPTRLYVGAFDPSATNDPGKLYRSVNGGASWFDLTSASLDEVKILDLIVNPADSAILNAATSLGMYRSSNNGFAWTRTFDVHIHHEIEPDPILPGVLHASSISQVSISSDDGGQTWSAPSLGPCCAHALDIARDGSDVIWAATNGGVLRSDNSGAEWLPRSFDLPFGEVRAIALRRRNPDIMHAGTWGSGFYWSNNNGFSWGARSTQIPDAEQFIGSIAIDSQATAIVYAANQSDVYRSNAAGLNWQNFSSGLTAPAKLLVADPAVRDVVYAATDDGVFKHTDPNGDWLPRSSGIPGSVGALAVDRSNNFRLLAGADTPQGFVYQSLDAGVTWTRLDSSPSGSPIRHLAIAESDPQTIVVTTDEGLHRSTDGGVSWTRLNSRIGPVEIDRFDARRFFVADSPEVVATYDGGASFFTVAAGLPADSTIFDLELQANDRLKLWAATTTGVQETEVDLFRDGFESGGFEGWTAVAD